MIAELLSYGSSVYKPPETPWPIHVHSFHQLDVPLAGEAIVSSGPQRLRRRRGEALLYPPLTPHGHDTRRGMTIAMFKFRVSASYWPLLGDRLHAWKLSRQALAAVEESAQAGKRHEALALQQATAALTLCLVEAARGLGHTQDAAPMPGGLRERLWQLLERIEAEPFGAWSVARLAGECHLTPDHFSRRFRELFKQRPQEYLLRTRMRAVAARLSAEPDWPIKRAAEDAGYATVHAFTRAFRRVLGLPPAAFRRTPSEL